MLKPESKLTHNALTRDGWKRLNSTLLVYKDPPVVPPAGVVVA